MQTSCRCSSATAGRATSANCANVVERMAILDAGRSHHRRVDSGRRSGCRQWPRPATGLQEVRDAAERDRIRQALDQTDWNVSGAARLLGTERTSLHKRLRALGLRRKVGRQRLAGGFVQRAMELSVKPMRLVVTLALSVFALAPARAEKSFVFEQSRRRPTTGAATAATAGTGTSSTAKCGPLLSARPRRSTSNVEWQHRGDGLVAERRHDRSEGGHPG